MATSHSTDARRYGPRACDDCGKQFQPTGGRHRFCAGCRAQRPRSSMVALHTQAPADIAAAFGRFAARRDRSVSAELRRLIRQTLQNDEDPAATPGLATTPADVTSGYETG